MEFGKGYWKTGDAGTEREWLITNGKGGYGGQSIINRTARMHHGYLIASLHPPVERFVILAKTDEELELNGRKYSLASNERVRKDDDGEKYLQRFIYNELPVFVYQAAGCFVTKTIAFERKKNTVVITYDIVNGPSVGRFKITPHFNYREHSTCTTPEDLKFKMKKSFGVSDKSKDSIIILNPEKNKDINISFYCSEGEIKDREKIYSGKLGLAIEKQTGGRPYIENYTPLDIVTELKPGEHKKISVVCSVEDEFEKDAFKTVESEKARIAEIRDENGSRNVITSRDKGKTIDRDKNNTGDDFISYLMQAADDFIVDRESTGLKTVIAGYPWFTDWGRDTMIALPGLTLSTGRFKDAREILKSFAVYEKNGLVPNVFPDGGSEPMYNTADASLWYVIAVYEYLNATGKKEDYAYIKDEIYAHLKNIIKYYKEGTENSIYMDKDYLIHAGSGYDQVTWMDVRVGKWVVTPRHGKPVEINALWCNALYIMAELAKHYKDKDADKYKELGDKASASFEKAFWNEKKGCLYDVVESGSKKDGKIRLNQIYAVSLPFDIISEDKRKAVVDTVVSRLYVTYGVRTLDEKNREYHPFYVGKLHDRDAAYHQGTAWGYPLGALVIAFLKTYGDTEDGVDYAMKLIEPVKDHLRDGCVGKIAEIFDGEEPNISRGTYNQAWSVGEILRAYMMCLEYKEKFSE